MVGGSCWVEMSGGWWLQDHNLELAIVGMGFFFFKDMIWVLSMNCVIFFFFLIYMNHVMLDGWV